MIIIKINDINFGLRNKPFNSYFRNNLDQIYSHVIFFSLKKKTILIQISLFLEFHEFDF